MAIKRNVTIIIRLGSLSNVTYMANIIATQFRKVMIDGQFVWQHWAFVAIPGIGSRWIPESYFVGYAA